LLADTNEDVPLKSVDNEPKKIKPPPIYIREKSTNGLVNSLICPIGQSNENGGKLQKSHKLSYCKQNPDVKPEKIAEALKEKGFCAKSVHNIKNRNRQPQPLFKIELKPENKLLKKRGSSNLQTPAPAADYSRRAS